MCPVWVGGKLQHSGTVLGTLCWPVPVCGTRVASATRSDSPWERCAFQEPRLEPSPAPEGRAGPRGGGGGGRARGLSWCPRREHLLGVPLSPAPAGRTQRELPASGLRKKNASVRVVCYINQGKTRFKGTGEGDSLAQRLGECLSQLREELGRNFCFTQA